MKYAKCQIRNAEGGDVMPLPNREDGYILRPANKMVNKVGGN
jgi:hypothetical protein